MVSAEIGADIDLADDAIEGLKTQSFSESNSRELRNVIERAIFRYSRETELLTWFHLKPFLSPAEPGSHPHVLNEPSVFAASTTPANLNDWQRRLRVLAVKVLSRGTTLSPEQARAVAESLFDQTLPTLWKPTEMARSITGIPEPIPWPVWEDLWRCFSVSWLGGPAPAERVLGIPANTLRQWINDRESR
ncbi:MAG: hypothetical protein NVSMB9_11510 [Isosphaeraceae bacterium]